MLMVKSARALVRPRSGWLCGFALMAALVCPTMSVAAPAAAAKPAWTALPAIRYRVLKTAAEPGFSPGRRDTVTVNYELKLADGKVVETTFGTDKPATLQLNRLIPGWQAVLPMMHVGDEWEILIPPQYAYGARGNETIPGDSTLDFRIELLAVTPPAPAP